MDEKQIFEQAQQMFLHERGRKEVIDFMMANGMDEGKAESTATEAFLSIRNERRVMALNGEGATYDEGGANSGAGLGSIVIGIILIVIGIGASMGTGRIFYGAVLVGIITLIQGIAKAAR